MSDPIPSATVVLLREVDQTLEVLLLKRNSKIAYGGAWVFPGGKIDAEDYVSQEQELIENKKSSGVNDSTLMEAARNAAYRETQEEAGLHIDQNQLLFFSHWTTPKIRPKRFSTWFFMAPAISHDVSIDGEEIHDHCWRTPTDALLAHQNGEIELVPPTYITLLEISAFQTIDSVIESFSDKPPQVFEPKVEVLPEGLCYLYHGDAGYDKANHHVTGARHRLYAKNSKDWFYERSSG